MKNVLFFMLLFSGVIYLSSCGEDEPTENMNCTQADWVGEWSIIGDTICDVNEDLFFEEDPIKIIEAGDTDQRINVDGLEIAINEETCIASAVGALYQIVDGKLTISPAENCVFEYSKN